MAFRRQDIPRTTRKSDKGGPRRLFPRYIRDLAPLPKIELAIAYLDEMVGRRRAELSPEVILDLFGDLKLARCLLSCLTDAYRYRSPEIAEVAGEEAAVSLAGWELLTPADLRAYVYAALDRDQNGVIALTERPEVLTRLAAPLGISGEMLGELLHLDAERNQVLIRVGPRPEAADVAARFNALLTLSILRQASSIELTLPGLDTVAVETICARDEVPYRRTGPDEVRLQGRRNTAGSWAGFGSRLARCAVQLLVACPRMPSGQAIVHLNDEPLLFTLDAKSVGPLRPKASVAAGADGLIRAATLADSVGQLRRKGGGRTNGWTVRRALEPCVVDGAIVVPELLFVRGEIAIAATPIPTGSGRAAALDALTRVNRLRPVIGLGNAGQAGVPSLSGTDADDLLDLLESVADGHGVSRSALAIVAQEFAASGWTADERLSQLLGESGGLAERLRPLTIEGEAVYLPGVGLCRVAVLDELGDRLAGGALDLAGLRAAVAEHVGAGPQADALTLHLLGQHPLAMRRPQTETDRNAAAA
jgi:hypothetical protein